MKRFITILVLLVCVLLPVIPVSASTVVLESANFKIIVNGIKTYVSDAIVVNDRTMLPYGEFLNVLGISNDSDHIVWDGKNHVLTVKDAGKIMEFSTGLSTARINGEEISLDAAPMIYKNSFYIPVRFISEIMGKKVVWDGSVVAIFIVDTDKYLFTRSVLDECNRAMEKISNLKTSINTAMTLSGFSEEQGFSVNLNSTGYSFYDASRSISHTVMDTDVADYEMKTEEYCANGMQYTQDVLTGEWTSKALTPEQFNSYLKSYTNLQITKNAGEAFCAGLGVNQSLTTDSTLVLSGSAFSDILFNQAEKKTSSLLKGSAINDFIMNIYIDKSTSYITKVTFVCNGSATLNDNPLYFNANIAMEFSDFDLCPEIVLPPEAENQQAQ